MTPAQLIIDELKTLRRNRSRQLTRAGCLGACTVSLTALAAALGIAQGGSTHLALSLAIGGLIAGGTPPLAIGAWTVWCRLRGTEQASRSSVALAQRLVPELASALASAIALTPELAALHGAAAPGRQGSAALAAEHLRRTAERLQHAELKRCWQVRYGRSLRWVGRSAGLAAVVGLACVAGLGAGRQRLWQALVDRNALRVSTSALVADLQVTYIYPAYTQRAPRQVQGSDGSLEAVAGTEVTLQARATPAVKKAWLHVDAPSGAETTEITARSIQGATLQFVFPLLHDGTYRFVVGPNAGERVADPQRHTLHAVRDNAPKVTLLTPAADVELRDDQNVAVQWGAEDDFGLSEAALVIERDGQAPQRLPLWAHGDVDPADLTAEGHYSWAVAALGLAPGEAATFYIAATDRDTHAGPKTGVSAKHHISIFSARAHHEEVLEKLRATLDSLVDALGFELEAPMPAGIDTQATWEAGRRGIDAALQRTTATQLAMLEALEALQGDALTQPQIREAFINVHGHVHDIFLGRQQHGVGLAELPIAEGQARLRAAGALQKRYTARLERDIVYLDDLLAVSRINELQNLAKGLLANQRELKGLLEQYRNSQDAAAKAELQRGIAALREQMLDVLRKMAEIKKNLPGEYRNTEASSMLRLDDQFQRLDKQLRQNDLDAASKELEALANMVENMAKSLGDAEQAFGGERYEGMREQLQAFAQTLDALEDEQGALSAGSDRLLAQYRQKAMSQAAKGMDDFVRKTRRLAHDGLTALDTLGQDRQLVSRLGQELEQARQGLLDVDSLLAHGDLAEAHRISPQGQEAVEALASRLPKAAESPLDRPAAVAATTRAGREVRQKAAAIVDLLDKLFPDAEQGLTPAQRQQMAALGQKQDALAHKAQGLAERMAQIGEQMPVFGGAPQQTLHEAQQQMQAAAAGLDAQALAEGSGHSRQAKEKLSQLRQALQQAAKQGDGRGVPLPLGADPSGRGGPGQYDPHKQDDVAIPAADRAKAGPTFRQDLLEAAKQKAPAYYEDAVRRYYNELIR